MVTKGEELGSGGDKLGVQTQHVCVCVCVCVCVYTIYKRDKNKDILYSTGSSTLYSVIT